IIKEAAYVIQILITVLAYIFNFVLIYIAQTCTRREIGSYRILILYFAISDIYYNTMHFVVYPIPEMYGNTFLMSGHGIYTELFGVALYCGAYGHAFPILIFHFIYRLLAIKYTCHLNYFKQFIFALILVTLAHNALWFSVFYWFFHPDKESLHLLTPLFNGSIDLPVVHNIDTAPMHAQALYWTGRTFEGPRYRNLIGTSLICLSMIYSYLIIIICSFLINKFLQERMKSVQSVRLQKQLFRSLIYQSFVPLFTAYLPAATCQFLPVFGLTFIAISVFCPFACATHPLVDPLLLIFTITEYRRAFLDLIGLTKVVK
ncbi:hypothetical protein PFISCL1PPCAC_13629, partial [Pristionchus fissidentatus]